MIKKVFRATLLIFLTISQTNAQKSKKDQWADSVYQTLDIDEKIAQLFMVPVYGNGNEQHFQVVDQLVSRHKVGGLIFMKGTATKQIKAINRFQNKAKVPLLVGMDAEWGLRMQLDSTIAFPRHTTLGAIKKNDLISDLGTEIARQMKMVGAHINFAPVADVSIDRDLLSKDMRTFSEIPERVAAKAEAFAKGLQNGGVLSCVKHFNNNQTESYLQNSRLKGDTQITQKHDLKPIKELIEQGTDAVITSHLDVNSIRADNLPPSYNMISSLLRNEMGDDGLVISDVLRLREIADQNLDGEAEFQAFAIGNDIILFPTDVPVAIRRIKKSLKKRSNLNKQLEKSVKRVLRAKYKAGLNQFEPLSTENLSLKLNSTEAQDLTFQLYEKAITVVKNQEKLLPITILDNKLLASITMGEDLGFSNYLDKYASLNHYQIPNKNKDSFLTKLHKYDVVIIGAFKENMSEEELSFLFELKKHTKVIMAYLGNPYNLRFIDSFKNIICNYENNATTQLQMAQAIFGAKGADGILPVSISDEISAGTSFNMPDVGRLAYSTPGLSGMDQRHLQKIDELVNEAIEDEATPGCQVLVAKDGKVVFDKSYGYHTYEKKKPVTGNTIYDLASVTKVSATLQAFMFLTNYMDIDLDKKISYYLPDLKGTNKENMTLRNILTHQAGLRSYIPFWVNTLTEEDKALDPHFYSEVEDSDYKSKVSRNLYTHTHTRDSLWKWIKESKLRRKRYKKPYNYRYSDIGYYMLIRLVEHYLNQPMEEFLQQNFYEPMGLTSLGYLPLKQFPSSRIAPTEDDQFFRKSLVHGYVHDQGAALMGGVAGHAGLFGTSTDLAQLMQMHLQDGEYGGTRYYLPGTIEKFTAQQYENNRRGLGWDKPIMAQTSGPASRYTSGKTFGHTGFTGTAVWVDPEFNLIYIFLSNRVHPNAENRKLIKSNIRTRIQDVIYESIWQRRKYHEIEPTAELNTP